jgi:hypothetical protein
VISINLAIVAPSVAALFVPLRNIQKKMLECSREVHRWLEHKERPERAQPSKIAITSFGWKKVLLWFLENTASLDFAISCNYE